MPCGQHTGATTSKNTDPSFSGSHQLPIICYGGALMSLPAPGWNVDWVDLVYVLGSP